MVNAVAGIFEREETEETGKAAHFDQRICDTLIRMLLSEMSLQIFEAHDEVLTEDAEEVAAVAGVVVLHRVNESRCRCLESGTVS